MKIERTARLREVSNEDATVARGVPQAPALLTAEVLAATDTTLSRIETVMNLLLLANLSAASIRGATTSDHDRLHATMVSSALDEALAEQRILWLELAPTMTAGVGESSRYRDVTRHYERRRPKH